MNFVKPKFNYNDFGQAIERPSDSTPVENKTAEITNLSSEKKAKSFNLPKVDAKLKIILDKISKGKFPWLRPTEKSTNWMWRNKSGRRSKYIGVSKNNR